MSVAIIGIEEKLPRTEEVMTDRTGLLRLIVRRGPGLSNLCRLLIGRKALPDNSIHIPLRGEDRKQRVFPPEMSERLPSS